ncbi:uncharacterized protein LOC122255428 isoform X2 [Penaeus japonicus]|uniref:uncharacterized protein LOC122255428 isoform X2 n=1 Tax=Penaeus japonicus TaxID=27405 RepID=UPI001C717AA1|nr:uncharacterized protein LOC122255428 isoform X2 [Penaeus japonicus]
MKMKAPQHPARYSVLLVLFLAEYACAASATTPRSHTRGGEGEDSTATSVVVSAEGVPGLLELSQAVTQLTQRLATLEVSLESRFLRLGETMTKGDALLESLSARMRKVDTLVEKVEALDTRLTHETSSLHSTLRDTNRDLQGMATKLGALESKVETGDGSRHETRSHQQTASQLTSETEIATQVNRRVSQYLDATLPLLFQQSMEPLFLKISKKIEKGVGELKEAWQQSREGLEDLGTQTLRTAMEVREEVQAEGKRVESSVQDIQEKMLSLHQDLVAKLTRPAPSLGELRPVLQQVNQSVAQSVARAAAGLNVTLLEEAARRNGGSTSNGSGDRYGRPAFEPLHCPDPNTIAALEEVKRLLQSVLKKSDDLRRGLTKQTSEGVDLLKLLHQRFSVLLRRMNTEPNHGQMLRAEMQELGSLVESSYSAVLVAQNAFIESCERIQMEEPTLELKITEILDKLVTNIDLGHQFNRRQLSDLRELVEHLGEGAGNGEMPSKSSLSRGAGRLEQDASSDSAGKIGRLKGAVLEGIESANLTIVKLEDLEEKVEELSVELLETDWAFFQQKEPADQLTTAAKDLKGFAQDQILQTLNLHESLLAILEQLAIRDDLEQQGDAITTMHLEIEHDALEQGTFVLPSECTAALIQQVRSLPEFQAGHQDRTTPATAVVEDSEDRSAVWFSGQDFGTPDRMFPLYRDNGWVDRQDDYSSDDSHDPESFPGETTTSPPLSSTSAVPGGVEQYFGIFKHFA